MTENNPELSGIFNDIQKLLNSNNKSLNAQLSQPQPQHEQLQLPQSISQEIKISDEEQEEFERDSLNRIFADGISTTNRDPREIALVFRNTWNDGLNKMLKDTQISDRTKKKAENTTLLSAATTAEKQFQLYQRQAGAAEPFSAAATGFRELADRWGRISQIVKEASELPK